MSDLIKLDRMGSTPWGTFGTLRLADGTAFPTIERGWEYNAPGKSCIPAGEYLLELRASPIVARSSGQAFRSGWEVTGVPGRDLIMIHPANWADELKGCIAPGRAHAVINGKPGVSASRAAFKDLMHRLARRESWRLAVRWVVLE
jgi:hypothetical protein